MSSTERDDVAAPAAPLHAWTCHHVVVPFPDGHPFPAGKHAPLLARILDAGICREEDVHTSDPAPIEWLLRVHDRVWVERVLEGSLTTAEQRVLGFPWSPELVARARAALFGTVMAARSALVHGVAGNLAGGSHHAFRERGEAYCLFNDVAAAIALLRDDGAARRPFVADLDVHQGNGTAAMLAGDPNAFTYSIHARDNYPARKEASTLDVPLPAGCRDDAYLEALDRTLPEALARHRPDIVFYQAGVDALETDRFGRLALTLEGLAERDARLFRWCRELAVPVVVTLGGGYGRPLESSIEAHLGVWRAARAATDQRFEGRRRVDRRAP